jgi:Endoplasmic Reticulum-Golgi Intermediate Compartment (ERGIC)
MPLERSVQPATLFGYCGLQCSINHLDHGGCQSQNTHRGVLYVHANHPEVPWLTRRPSVVTLVSFAIILSFTMIEFLDYRRVGIDTSVVVDRSRGEKLTVHLNVTFPRVPCYRAYFTTNPSSPPPSS